MAAAGRAPQAGHVGSAGVTSCFAGTAAANPDRVWAALTCPEARYLHGLAVRGGWDVGSAIEVGTGESALRGTVLAAVPGERLSFAFGDPSGTAVYITFELRACARSGGASTVVRLWIDDTEGGTTEELEDTWLPVLACVTEGARSTPAG